MPAKKTTRRKAYKNMSVSELVKERAELAEKIQKIDEVLGVAVDAVGVKVVTAPSPVSPTRLPQASRGYDAAFGSPSNYQQPASAQIAVSTEAPVVAPRANNAPDQSSGFTIFDADSFARQQAETEQQYLVNNPGTPVPPEYDFASEDVADEISSLKKQIAKGLGNEGDTSTDSE